MRTPWLDNSSLDVRSAFRELRRRPGFAAAVIATLALGLGANAAVFSVVDQLLFRPPPMLREPSLTHRVYISYPMPGGAGEEFLLDVIPYARYADLTAGATSSFERTALTSVQPLAIGVGDAAREMQVAAVSASFFGLFDAPPSSVATSRRRRMRRRTERRSRC